MSETVKIVPKGVLYDRNSEKAYWGHCLHPEHENFQANIGEDNWFYCPICKIKWYHGTGNFSNPDDWPMEKLVELWLSNKKILDSCEDMTGNLTFRNEEDIKENEKWNDFFGG